MTSGIRVIARNEKGEVMGALQTFVHGTVDPYAIKAHAIYRALQFAHHIGFTSIILERDMLSVINKIKSPYPSLSDIGNLIEDVKDMMKLFRKCKIQYVRREANEASHLLAKGACLIEEEMYWVEAYPDFLYSVVSSECDSISV